MNPKGTGQQVTGTVSSRCKLAFDRIIAMNSVNSALSDFGNMLGSITSPLNGLFTMDERMVIDNTFSKFSSEIDQLLAKKFSDVGMILEDCMRREMISRF